MSTNDPCNDCVQAKSVEDHGRRLNNLEALNLGALIEKVSSLIDTVDDLVKKVEDYVLLKPLRDKVNWKWQWVALGFGILLILSNIIIDIIFHN